MSQTYLKFRVKKRYEVLTWDYETESWTPQKGLRRGPWSKWGLRKVFRTLRSMGYGYGRRNMMSVWIQEIKR